jgi:putative membrane protein
MTVDALLAIAHHLAVFSLVALLVVELVIVRAPMGLQEITRFGRFDGMYGIAAVVVIVVGIARLVFGAVPVDFYLANLFFWLKMGSLGAISLISVYPTVRGMAWRKAATADAAFTAPAADVRGVRRALHVELAILPLIPISAVLMARGIGALGG